MMNSRIKTVATPEQALATSIKCVININGRIEIGEYCVVYESGAINQNALAKMTPREWALARRYGLVMDKPWPMIHHDSYCHYLAECGDIKLLRHIFKITDIFARGETRHELRKLAIKRRQERAERASARAGNSVPKRELPAWLANIIARLGGAEIAVYAVIGAIAFAIACVSIAGSLGWF